MYMEVDIALFDKCSRENAERAKAKEAEREGAAAMWATLKAQSNVKE